MQRTCLSIAALQFRSQKQSESICAGAHHDERLLTNSLVPHLSFFTVSSPVCFQTNTNESGWNTGSGGPKIEL